MDLILNLAAHHVGWDYRGYYILEMSGKTPDDSKEIWYYKVSDTQKYQISKEQLMECLTRFIHPLELPFRGFPYIRKIVNNNNRVSFPTYDIEGQNKNDNIISLH